MRGRIAGVLMAVLLMGSLHTPASAGVEVRASIVDGMMRLGAGPNGIDGQPDGPNHDPIPHDGNCWPDMSKGLHWPGMTGPGKTTDSTFGFQVNKRAYYRLVASVGGVHVNSKGGSNGVSWADLTLCGVMDPGVGGIGAACGWSSGHSGRGHLILDDGTIYAFSNVGWATSLGEYLPIQGHVQKVDSAGNALDAKGVFHGLLRAAPGWVPYLGECSWSKETWPGNDWADVQGALVWTTLLE